jgi:hypothetical protein
MRLFLRITIVYLVLGMTFVTIFRDDPLPLIVDLARSMPQSFGLFLQYGWWVLIPFTALFVVVPDKVLFWRLPAAAVMTFVCGVFFLTFTMVKNSLSQAVPFFAGPALAEIDRLLHFGTDPWRLAHLFAPWINADVASGIYAGLWFIPAMYFPVLLRLFDSDEGRIARFVTLHAFAWIILGNVVALMLMSEGPVYYDRVNGGTLFQPLIQALADTGLSATATGNTQAILWQIQGGGDAMIGSGISAFPSVHVAMITVMAVYAAERLPALALPAVLAVAIYQFLSVYLGWHYAVDGYASILAVVLLHRFLRRRGFDLRPGGRLAAGRGHPPRTRL